MSVNRDSSQSGASAPVSVDGCSVVVSAAAAAAVVVPEERKGGPRPHTLTFSSSP